MHFVSVTYSLRSPFNPDNWVEFLRTIKHLGDWHHPIEPMWLLYTEYTAEEVYHKIDKAIDKCCEIYHITEFDPHNMHGLLLSASWAWLKTNMDKNDGKT